MAIPKSRDSRKPSALEWIIALCTSRLIKLSCIKRLLIDGLLVFTIIMDSDESHVKIAYESQDGESQERSQDGEFPSVGFIEKEEVQCDVEPVRLVSIRPLVDTNDHSDSINSVVEQPSRQTARDLSKYNWKHFLPITRR